MSVQIRSANFDDLMVLVNFQLKMAMETEKIELDKSQTLLGVKKVLEQPLIGEYLIAVKNIHGEDVIVASLLILKEWSDWRNKEVLWIHSVYVEKEFRQMGIFSKMYSWVQEKVQTSDLYCGIRLFVDKSNKIAQNCYKQLGMDNQHYDLYEFMK